MSSAAKKQDSQSDKILDAAYSMKQSGVPSQFILTCLKASNEFGAIGDLMIYWNKDAENEIERAEAVADLHEMLQDLRVSTREAAKINFSDLAAISNDIVAFKLALKNVVLSKCKTIEKAAEKLGWPQSALSRFFNTAAMPRAATLQKFAEVFDLSAVEVASKWSI